MTVAGHRALLIVAGAVVRASVWDMPPAGRELELGLDASLARLLHGAPDD
jgi:hypothetical protein